MKGITNATKYPPAIYGFEVDTDVSATPNNISYVRDAEGMTYSDRAALYTSICAPCVVSRTTGDVNYYLDPSNGNLKVDGTTARLDGTDGDVCVRVTKIWYKSYFNGAKERFEFCLQDPAAVGEYGFDCYCHYYGDKTLPYIFIGMFKTSGGTGGCVSINATTKPATYMNMTQFETGYKATGASTDAQYLGVGMLERCLITKLLTFLSGSTNSQGYFGNGYVGAPSSESSVTVTNLGFNATSMLVSGDTSASLSGVMSGYFNNLWGNVWEFLHQCCFNNYKVKFTIRYDDLVTDITTATYSSLPSTWYESNETLASVSVSQWYYPRSMMANDAPCCVFPRIYGGSSSTYYYDGIFVDQGSVIDRCVVAGGAAYNNAEAGLYAFPVDTGVAISGWRYGSRLLVRPIQLAR